jgi:beta-N-acetylhexosaminidase
MNKRTAGKIVLGLAVLLVGAAAWLGLTAEVFAPGRVNQPVAVRTTGGPTPAECIERLPAAFQAGQLLMVGLPAAGMTVQAPLFFHYSLGGVALMTAPLDPGDGSIAAFKAAAASRSVRPLVATDEEGGSIQRFAGLGVLPAPAQVAADMTPAQAQQLVYRHGLQLKAAGVDMVLGPLADVAPAPGGGVLGDRVFSADPAIVRTYDNAYIRGWQAAGLLPTLKHFPGLGSATANTDYVPAATPPLSYLQRHDFVPYEALAGSGTAVMVGNQTVPGWFSGPASLSPAVNRYLRDTLGYGHNLVITDSLSAAAVTSVAPEPQAVLQALQAGNDMALVVEQSSDTLSDTQALVGQATALVADAIARGTLPKQQVITSLLHKFAVQHVQPCSIPLPRG